MPANVTFRFTDRDFPTASPPITSFSFSEKEKEGKRKTAQGTAPQREFILSSLSRDENMNSRRLRPPRPPRRTGKPGETNNRDVVHSGESFRIRGKTCLSAIRTARFQPWLPLEGKLRPQAVMRCSAPARLCRQMLLFASLTEILRLRRRL